MDFVLISMAKRGPLNMIESCNILLSQMFRKRAAEFRRRGIYDG